MANQSHAWLALALLCLASTVDLGHGQAANCYSNSIFGCSGDTIQRANGQACCDEGFLAFQTLGEETCSPCPDNSICQASSDCSDTFPGLGTQSSAQCCATGGGVAYTNSAGNCVGCPSAIEGCFDDTGCSGDSVSLSSTGSGNQVRECCLGSGLSYSLIDQCIDCTVYGFLQDEVNESERGQGYPIQIGYIKGSGGILRGRVNVVPGGTAVLGSDFSLSSTVFTARAGNPAEIIVTFRVDSVAQEVDETAQIQLSLTTTPPSGAIFQDTIDFLIRDSDDVIFQLTENDYRSNENELRMNIVVNKNVRLANPVTFLLTPYNVSQANNSGEPLPANVPPNDNPFSPNRAKSYPEDRQDFSSDVVTVVFPADETGPAINDVDAPVAIFNDVINEAQEEVFVVVLTLENSTNPDSITISRPSSLCRIIDDDEIRIGFQNSSYTFLEPEFETEIFNIVFLEKEGGRISEQTFLVVIESSVATPNANIRPAAISTEDDDGNIINNDYVINNPGVTVVIPPFGPEAQTLDFQFTLFPDSLAEGLEAFQASSSPSEDTSIPDFSAPTPNVLYASTFIIIVDNDPITIGLEQNFTVAEDVGSFQACFRVFNPPDNEDFALNLDLVIDTVAGTAGELDYTPIRSSNLDVFETLGPNQRRACFDVVITADNVFENDETFSLRLDFDEFVPQATRDSVTIEPSVVYVTIQDVTPLTIGFIDPPYSALESDGVISGQVGVIGGTRLEREVVVDISTVDGVATGGRAAFAGSDFTAVSNFPLTFNSGVSSITIEVSLIDDDVFELTESFSGQLSLPAPVDRLTLGPATAGHSIRDDDALVVGFNPITYSFSEDAGAVQTNVDLTGDSGAFVVSFDYETVDGTARAGSDYDAATGSLQFSGTSSVNIDLNILEDLLAEGLETFRARLSGLSLSLGGNAVQLNTEQEAERLSFNEPIATIDIEDNDVARIGFIQTSYSVVENGVPVEFLIGVLEGNLAVTVDVDFATADGTALDGSDYNETSVTLQFTGTETQSVFVDVFDDDIYENVENFFANLTQGAAFPDFVTLGPVGASATITDDDIVTIGFQPDSYDVNEADGTVTFNVAVLEGEIADGVNVLVSFFTSDGSAQAGFDYTQLLQDLTFTSGATSQQVTVDITNDDLFENIETFFGNLQIAPGTERVVLNPEVATVNIADEDELIIGFNPDAYQVTEIVGGSSVGLVVMVISGSLGRNVQIPFSTADGLAVAGSDYTSVTRTLTFTPDIDMITVPVVILDDSSVEPEEDFNGLLTDPVIDRLTVAPATATVNILDNDNATIGFDRGEYDVIENAGFSNVTIRLNGMISKNIVVRVSTADGSAVSVGPEIDFVSHDMEYTFTPGGPTEIIVPIRIIDDSFVEYDEDLSSIITLSTVSDVIELVPAQATIRIIDDDQVVIGFTQTQYDVTEGVDANAPLVVSVLMGTLRRNVVVNAVTQDGSALAGSDYTGQTFSFTFNEDTTSIPFPIPILDDDINEVVETFIGRLMSDDVDVILSPVETTVRITDNDVVQVSFQEPMYMFSEGVGNATVCVDKIGDTTQTIMVMVSGPLQAETGESISEVVTFAPDEVEQCVTFEVIDDNIALEEPETFTWSLTLISNPELVELGVNPTTDIVILDDDTLTISLEKAANVPENATVAQSCITFSNPFARDFVISSATQMAPNTTVPAVAEPDVDFGSLLIDLTATPADGDAGQLCFDIDITDDDLVEEAMECFGVNIRLPEDERDNVLVDQGSAVCCIVDDDTVTIGFDPIIYFVNEGEGSVELTVRIISGELARPVEVTLTTEDGSATSTAPVDYINPGQITLQFDSVAIELPAIINIEDDDIFENIENFFANLVSFDSSVIIDPIQAEIRISEDPENNDRPTIGFVPDSYAVTEDAGTVSLNVEVISGILEREVEVMFSTSSGTATEEAPADYIGTTMTITFSDTVSNIQVPVGIIDDDIVEADENFNGNLAIADPMDAFLVPDVATVVISGEEPNDSVVIGLESDYTVTEGNTQEVCAILVEGTLERDAVVTLTTVDGSAEAGNDYDGLDVELTFNAGTNRACTTLVTTDDSLVEGSETLTLMLTTTDTAVQLNPDNSNVEILDNDVVTIGVTETSIQVDEDEMVVEVCAEIISGELARDLLFTLTSDDGTALAPADYGALAPGALMFTADIDMVCVNVTIVNDDIYENDEIFTVTVATEDDQAEVDPNFETVTVTILDEDSLTIGFNPDVYSVSETDGTVQVCASILAGNLDLERDVFVAFFTSDGTMVVENDAVAPGDYTATTVTLTFNSANTEPCVDVPIITDEAVEGTEVFWSNLDSNASRVTIAPEVARISIVDANDALIGYRETPYSFPEDGGIATIVVAVVMGTLQEDVVVNLRSEDIPGINNGAVADVDYTPINVNLTFNSENTEFSIDVPLTNDGFDELDELFNARITILTEGTNTNIENEMPLAPVEIVDDDGITIGLEVTDIADVEDVGMREICAVITDGNLMREAIVTLTGVDGTAIAGEDYDSITVQLTFDPDTSRACTNVVIIDDERHELNETFTIVLTTDDPDITLDPDTGTFTIIDNDEVVIGWEVTVYNVTEGEDPVVELCAVIRSGELTFALPAIDISTMDGSATSSVGGQSQDYIGRATPALFTFSDTSANRMCTTIGISDNEILEETLEDFFVDLTISSNVERVTVDPSRAQVNILDNDPVVIGFTTVDYTFDEGIGVGQLLVGVISGILETDIEVRISSVDGSALSENDQDFTSVSQVLTFSGSQPNQMQPVSITDDNIDEVDFEEFTAHLELVTDNNRVTIEPLYATVNIEDNDVVTIGFEREMYVAVENNTITTEVCARITDDSPGLDRVVVVEVTSSDGSAEAPADYDSVSELLTFGPDVSRVCITVTTKEDDVVEDDEEFTLRLNSTDDVDLDPDTATVVIDEMGVVRVMFAEPTYTFSENGVVGRVEVVKFGFTDSSFQVQVVGGPSTQTDVVISGDGINEIQTFEAGPDAPSSLFFEFEITDDDVGLEAIEQYIADLTIVGDPDGVMLGMTIQTQVNILDDDPVSVSFGRPEITVIESTGFFTMCVLVNRRTLQDVTVTLVSEEGTALADSDYIPDSIPSTVTIVAGNDRVCFNGTIVDDLAQEDDEMFNLRITGTGPDGVTVDGDTTTITIIDDEEPRVRFEEPTYTFSEDVGTAEVCLIKDLMTAGDVMITVQSEDVTAVAGDDYVGGPYSVTFSSAANDRQCITITLIADSESESPETFTAVIDIDTGSPVRPGVPSTTTITILDTGIQVNDTAIGDPLMTVPLLVSDDDLAILNTSQVSLCYEIHGASDQFFNLVTDECASVNARYNALSSYLNVINQIGVRATDDNNQCRNILVDVDGCTATVDGVAPENGRYASGGVSVRRYANRVRIAVPNCNELTLVMWVFCESRTMDDPEAPGGTLSGEMIKFVVMRGLNFGHRKAHGIIGQFWNIPARVTPFTGLDVNGAPQPNRYVVNITASFSGEVRSFTGWYYPLTWSFEEGPCLYVGNRQAGPIQEVADPNDPVIEGVYADYMVQSAFSELEYDFGLFNEDRCGGEGSAE